ncbi:hypothetical protein DITRI_Ditri01bG0071100 [Diplodiscus trichospermus]
MIKPHAVLLKILVLVNSKCDLLPETECAFSESRKKGFAPDITTLNATVSIYGRRQMVSNTNEILTFMNESGYAPSLTAYNSLMYMYSCSENFEESEKILRGSSGKGNAITYNTFVASYAADSMFERVVDVVRYVIKHCCKPNQNLRTHTIP